MSPAAGANGFSVTSTALAAAARTANEVALDLAGAEVAAPVARLAAVLPGSATAAAADGLAVRWGTAAGAVAVAMATQAGHLAGSAARYQGTDTDVAGRLGAAG